MHMSYPLLPRHAPAPGIQRLDSQQGNAFQGLAEMMHFGLSHFVGRGLPTIWSSIGADCTEIASEARSPFTPNDLQIIRHWARKLDDWLVLYNGTSRESTQYEREKTDFSKADISQNPVHRIGREYFSCCNIISINSTSFQYITLLADSI